MFVERTGAVGHVRLLLDQAVVAKPPLFPLPIVNDQNLLCRNTSRLRAQYAKQLPVKAEEIAESWRAMQRTGVIAEGCLGNMADRLHGWIGQAGAFGFTAVSEAAQRFEMFLRGVNDGESRPVTPWLTEQMESFLSWLDMAVQLNDEEHWSSPDVALENWLDLSANEDMVQRRSRACVYLLEDNQDFAREFCLDLEIRGYRPVHFTSVEAFTAALDQQSPDVAILDVILDAGVDAGIGLAAALRSSGKLVCPILFLTGRSDFQARLNAVRVGATFYFAKPVDVGQLVEALDSLVSDFNAVPYRVVLLQDDAASANQYKRWMEEAGMNVVVAENAESVLTLLDALHPELLLVDLHMADCSGPELAAVMRQFPGYADIPILFFFGESDAEKQLAATYQGGDTFLTKPITQARLIESVKVRVRRFRNMQWSARRALLAVAELQEFKEALDQHAIVSITDRLGVIIYANRKFCEISGYSHEELIGKNHRIVKGDMPPELYEDLWRTIAGGRVWRGELRNRRKDGRYYWVESSVVPLSLDENGVPQRYIGIRTEVTALKEVQETLLKQTELLEVLRQAVLRYIDGEEAKDIAAYLLQAMVSLTESEYGFLGEVRYDDEGAPYLFFLSMTDISWDEASRARYGKHGGYGVEFHRLDTLFGAVLTSGKPMISNDAANDPRRGGLPPGHPPMHCFLGVPVYYGGTMLAIYGCANRKQGYDQALLDFLRPFDATVAVVMDAMHRAEEMRAMQEMLLETKEEAERASNAKTEFLSRMSHELRTPLNAVLGFAQLMDGDPDAPLSVDQKENLDQILRAGWHLLTLINEVLDLSRIESGKVVLDTREVALSAVLDECVSLLGPLATERRVSVHVDEAFSQIRAVWADEVRVKQVLLNLLSNAIKYNRLGGEVRVYPAAAGEGRARLAVRDTGAGLNEEQLEHLFEAFNRMGAEQTEVEGAGIGLVIAKRLVEMMGGEIGVHSSPGEGSTFWVELPVVGEELAADVTPSEIVVTGLSPAPAVKHRHKVLYVEDNAANLRVIDCLLARHGGYELIAAPDAEIGIALARRHLPDVILMDINLPAMDGYAALAKLRTIPETRHIPVVALSANAMLGDVNRGLAAGFDAYLAKPVKVSEVLETLRHYTGEPDEA
ncbi:MAG: response regulator [Methylococcaceae bacterium]|nr:MAG: response regulator [Methylococcaceae bacterium]